MPRQPDPDLESRILNAAQKLWKRGGDKALTMRAVARAAGTNTPAVYRRFKDRKDLVRGLLLRTMSRVRQSFEAGETIEEIAEVYVNLALDAPHEYELFYNYAHEFAPLKGPGRPMPIRELRPNFALLEQRLAERLGGSAEDHTRRALAVWALLHGTTTLLLQKAVVGHEEELRSAGRAALEALLNGTAGFKDTRSASGRSKH
jgi:AcrR family transcriptional regulator